MSNSNGTGNCRIRDTGYDARKGSAVGGASARAAESVDVILANISGSQNAARIPTT